MDTYTRPDFSSVALITIDTQRDTLDGQSFEVPGTSAVLPKVQNLLSLFRQHRKPIIHIVRIYKRDGSNVDLCRRQAVMQGAEILIEDTPGCELPPELLSDPKDTLDYRKLLDGRIQKVSENEVIIYKPRWGAFFQTPLDEHLKSLKVSTLIFTGCNFPNCPRTSIYEASERDYRTILIEDALSGLYLQGRKEMENIGVCIMNASELLNAIKF
ncbi:cysteine hydrolase family protein [Thermodesulfobacteriota bacterium]